MYQFTHVLIHTQALLQFISVITKSIYWSVIKDSICIQGIADQIEE